VKYGIWGIILACSTFMTLQGFRLHSSISVFQSCVFFHWDISVTFLLRPFGHWTISVICLTVAFKLTVAVFISIYFQTLWPKWLNFFRSFQKHFGPWPKKKQFRSTTELKQKQSYLLAKHFTTGDWFHVKYKFSLFNNQHVQLKYRLLQSRTSRTFC